MFSLPHAPHDCSMCSAFYTCISLSGILAADYSGYKWSLAESLSGEWLFLVVVVKYWDLAIIGMANTVGFGS